MQVEGICLEATDFAAQSMRTATQFLRTEHL